MHFTFWDFLSLLLSGISLTISIRLSLTYSKSQVNGNNNQNAHIMGNQNQIHQNK